MSISIQQAVEVIARIDALNRQIACLLYKCHSGSHTSREDDVHSLIRTMSDLAHKVEPTAETDIVCECVILLDAMDELVHETADTSCYDQQSFKQVSMSRACSNYRANPKAAGEIAEVFAHLLDLVMKTENQK